MKPRRCPSGYALPAFMVFMGLVAAMTFALAERNIIRLRFMQAEIDGTIAESIAQSGLATAIARFKLDKAMGKHGEVFREIMPSSRDPQAFYELSFSTPSDGKAEPGKCVNNHRSDTLVMVGDVRCPKNGLYLTAIGHCRGTSRRVSVVLASPPFDYAIASTGPIRSKTGMVLGSVPKGFDANSPLDDKLLEPASLLTVSKDDSQGASVDLAGECTIVGDLKAVGTIHLAPNVVPKKGQQLPNSAPEDIPNISSDDYPISPDLKPQELTASSFDARKKLYGLVEWKSKAGETLEFKDGLDLGGATFRVKGNLTVRGGISGAGGLIVDGNVTILGSNAMRADNQLAVLAGGDISVFGVDREKSSLSGILYARGPNGVSINKATVLGAVMAVGKNPQTGEGAQIQVEEARVAFSKTASKVSVDLGWTGYPPGGIETKAKGIGDSPGVLKLLPLVGPDGNVILEPKPKDFLAAGITTLGAAQFSFQNGSGQGFFPKGTPKAVTDALGGGFVEDGDGTQIQAGWDSAVRNSGDQLDQMKDVLKLNPDGKPKAQPVFKLDLNQFLKTSERLRIVRRID